MTLLDTIHDLRGRYVAGDDSVAPDLHAYRMRYLMALYARRCVLCGRTGHARHDTRLCPACDAALAAAGQRRCTQCGEIKEVERFYRRPDTGRRRRICTPCYGARLQQRYPEARQAALERFHARNPGYCEERNAAAYAADPAAAKARTYAWRERNRERYNATQAAWREKQRRVEK